MKLGRYQRGPFGPDLLFTGELAGQNMTRRGKIARIFADGIAMVDASDGPQFWPRRFFVRSYDCARFHPYLFNAWSKNQPVIAEFALQKPLGPDFTERLELLSTDEQIKVIAELRNVGVLPELKVLSARTLPKGLLWAELKNLYLKQMHEF